MDEEVPLCVFILLVSGLLNCVLVHPAREWIVEWTRFLFVYYILLVSGLLKCHQKV